MPDWNEVIKTVGYVGLFAIVFAESGLLIGFFLPGDSLLFSAGFLASQGVFHPGVLALVCIVAAITGDAVGYAFGRRVGRRLYERRDSRWFKRKHLDAAEVFYRKHGGKTIVLARFLPVVRTMAPIVAGASLMPYSRFVFFNVTGGLIWGGGLTLAGYWLGSRFTHVDRYLIPIILLIILISVAPTLLHLWANHRQELFQELRRRRAGRRGRVDERQP